MGDWPGDLDKKKPSWEKPPSFSDLFRPRSTQEFLEQVEIDRQASAKLTEEAAARHRKELDAAAATSRQLAADLRATVLGQLQIGSLERTHNSELDARLGATLDGSRALMTLASIVNDKSVPIAQREKLLEVMILRGIESSKWDVTGAVAGIGTMAVGYSREGAYQAAAQQAIRNDPELFKELSKSGDNLPPPSSRAPATELIYTMLRDRDRSHAQEDQNRQAFMKWVRDLPPETQGRAMFHLGNAAATKDYDEHAHVTGFEFSFKEVGFGIQWDRAPDTHWSQVADVASRGVVHDLKGDEAKAKFSKGFQEAKLGAPE